MYPKKCYNGLANFAAGAETKPSLKSSREYAACVVHASTERAMTFPSTDKRPSSPSIVTYPNTAGELEYEEEETGHARMRNDMAWLHRQVHDKSCCNRPALDSPFALSKPFL